MTVRDTNPRFESEVPSVWNSIIARFDMVRVTDGREVPHDFLWFDAFQQNGSLASWRQAGLAIFKGRHCYSLRLHFVDFGLHVQSGWAGRGKFGRIGPAEIAKTRPMRQGS